MPIEPIRFLQSAPDAEVMAQARSEGYTPLQAAIIAGRMPREMIQAAGGVAQALQPGLRHIAPPDGLPDIERAAGRIADAIVRKEPILVAVDHDGDGVSGGTILGEGLVNHLGADPSCVQVYTTDRLSEGYGLSTKFLDRILAGRQGTGIVLTADQGSSDGAAIARHASSQFDFLITDHHLVPVAGPPAAAYACVNPARKDSRYADPLIAGCQVAWLVLWATRRELQRRGVLSDHAPSLAPLLAFSCVGTTADCVSFSRSLTNRAVTVAGLGQINANTRPCWKSLRAVLGRNDGAPITTRDLGFGLCPRLNAAGRLGSAAPGVALLRTQSPAEADRLAAQLDDANAQRRQIQDELVIIADAIAQRQVDAGARGIAIVFDEGHPGIHGIVASKLVAKYGRPVACASPKVDDPQTLSASFRGVPGFHVRDALERIQNECGIWGAMGGHAMAAGSRFQATDAETFIDAFQRQAMQTLPEYMVGPSVTVDAPLDRAPSLAMLEEIDALEPFGREFESPVLDLRAQVLGARPMGNGTHLRLELGMPGGERAQAVWFGARDAAAANDPVALPQKARFAVRLSRNAYQGRVTAQAQVVALQADE